MIKQNYQILGYKQFVDIQYTISFIQLKIRTEKIFEPWVGLRTYLCLTLTLK